MEIVKLKFSIENIVSNGKKGRGHHLLYDLGEPEARKKIARPKPYPVFPRVAWRKKWQSADMIDMAMAQKYIEIDSPICGEPFSEVSQASTYVENQSFFTTLDFNA